jgi:serine/threonine-protein kinase
VTTQSAVTYAKNHEGDLAGLFEGTPYLPVQRLRSGGMGELVLVEHREVGRTFVAKILHRTLANDPLLIDRLRLEAQTLGALSHDNIVSVVGFDRASDGRPFFVMERLNGPTLREELANRKVLPVLEAVAYTLEVLAALNVAHRQGVVHRDIKPDNLILHTRADGRRSIKVLDFGVARIIPGVSELAPRPLMVPTATGAVVGTPRFISPEGAAGRQTDQRADLYAAGLLLYTMLAGRGPFDHREGHQHLLGAHATERPEPPSRYAAEPVPPELDRVILKALEKNPDDRFQTADEFARVLRHAAESLTRPVGWAETSVFDARVFSETQSGGNSQPPADPAADKLDSTDSAAASGTDHDLAELNSSRAPIFPSSKRAPGLVTQVALFLVVALGAGVLGSVLVGVLRGVVEAP